MIFYFVRFLPSRNKRRQRPGVRVEQRGGRGHAAGRRLRYRWPDGGQGDARRATCARRLPAAAAQRRRRRRVHRHAVPAHAVHGRHVGPAQAAATAAIAVSVSAAAATSTATTSATTASAATADSDQTGRAAVPIHAQADPELTCVRARALQPNRASSATWYSFRRGIYLFFI